MDPWEDAEWRCRVTGNETPVAPGLVSCEVALLDAVCCNPTEVLLGFASDGGMVELLRAGRDDAVIGGGAEVVNTKTGNEVLTASSIDVTRVPLVGTARVRGPAETLNAGISEDVEDPWLDGNIPNNEEVAMDGAIEVKLLWIVFTGS